MKGLTALALLAAAGVSLALLISGAGYLEFVLPGGLPAGNALAAIGFASGAAVPVCLSNSGSPLRRAALAVFVAAASWLPLSVALAGNLDLNFPSVRGSIWLGFSLVVILAMLCTLTWGIVSYLVTRWRTRAA